MSLWSFLRARLRRSVRPEVSPCFPSAPVEGKARVGDVELSFREVVPRDLEEWARAWRPHLAVNDPTLQWPWDEHIERASRNRQFICLGAFSEHGLEGLLSLSVETSKSTGRRVAYIEYVVSAPWNQGRHDGGHQSGRGRIRGVGQFLLGIATTLSKAAGLGGFVGLHSKDEALEFYRTKVRWLQEFDRDTVEDGRFVYFEGASE